MNQNPRIYTQAGWMTKPPRIQGDVPPDPTPIADLEDERPVVYEKSELEFYGSIVVLVFVVLGVIAALLHRFGLIHFGG